MEFEPVIGLEVHVELKTNSKMFCGCPADYFGKEPNTQTCPVCLGLPGALPVPNKKAIEWAILLAKAFSCRINESSKFDRKNYFYPDLPKGYQISQYDEPIAVAGLLKFGLLDLKLKSEVEKIVRIRRVHLEEDTGKLVHGQVDGEDCTMVDFNRSGVPLVEIVTEPDLRSSEEAKVLVKEIQRIIQYLKISEADMEKGTMRLEPSISLRLVGSTDLPNYRVEIKNINSFRFTQKALDYEIERQKHILLGDGQVGQETRGWDENKSMTVYQRAKEEANDYRYFPEPDIPPLRFSQDFIREAAKDLPELPLNKIERFIQIYQIRRSEAVLLCENQSGAQLFEELVRLSQGQGISPQEIANLLVNKKIEVNSKSAADILVQILQSKTSISEFSDEAVAAVCHNVIQENGNVVDDFRAGKEKVLDFLIGQVIKKMKDMGRLDPSIARRILQEIISHG